VRETGIEVRRADAAELRPIVETWLREHTEGIACVIAAEDFDSTAVGGLDRLRVLTPELAKGLEFDLVVLVDPESFGDDVAGAVDRYVAMTRATQQLVILRSRPAL